MIKVTFNAADAYLLDDFPDWGRADVTVDASIPSAYERSLTGKETRRNTGDTLRLALKWTAFLRDAEQLTNLRNSLQALAQQPVLCPFWPAAFTPGDAPPVTTPNYVLFGPGRTFNSIVAAANIGAQSPTLSAFPLLVGILTKTPEVPLTTSRVSEIQFEFSENDPTNFLTPPAFVPPNGIAAASGVRPMFPFAANWVTPPDSGSAEYDIAREQIGEVRALSQVYYTQRNRRRIRQDLLLTNYDSLNLLSFFKSMGGEVQSFWLPANLKEANLTADVAAADTALNVDNPGAIGTNTFICLNDGTNRLPLVVQSVAGNQWNLSGAVGETFAAALTNLESLVLARFDSLKLSLNFIHSRLAKTTISFKELPWETAAVAGETIGTTMGPLPTTAMLYVFTLTTPGANVISRYTNFERDLTDGNGNVYTSAPIENDVITDAPNLERQGVSVKSRNFPGNPMALVLPFQLEFPLLLDIYEADVTGNTAGNLRCYFDGEVGDVSLDGPILTAACKSLSWMFDRTTARRLFQKSDNWNLFEPANGLNPDDWRWNAVVVSYDPATCELIIGTITANNAGLNGGTSLDAHYFAAGYCKITTAGADQYRMVGDSTLLTAGQITLYLTSPLITAPAVGDTVWVYAGYDGQYQTAINKFANGGNFGGFPWMPTGNPFVMKINSTPGMGKK